MKLEPVDLIISMLDSHDFSLYPWLNIFRESLTTGTRNLNLPHVPGFPLRKFENILGSVVYNAVKGIMSPEEALQYAQNLYDTQFSSRQTKAADQ
jgi:multiple sugar transport system substrate-binding protein